MRFTLGALSDGEDESRGPGIFDFIKSAALLVLLIAIALGSAAYFVEKLTANRKPAEVASNSSSSTSSTASTKPPSATPTSSSSTGTKTLPVATQTAYSVPLDDLPQIHRNRAAELAPRWTAQQLRLANRKTEAQGNIQQLQFDIQRTVMWRDGMVAQRNDAQQKMIKGTLDFADGAETNSGKFLRGFVGGAATGYVIEEFNKKIAEGNATITRLSGTLGEWQNEKTRVSNLEIQFAQWPRYEGHCYPTVRSVTSASLAQGINIQPGDMFIYYNDFSFAYVSNPELSKPMEDVRRNGLATVEVGFARNGTLMKHKVPGGQLLGVGIDLPIQE